MLKNSLFGFARFRVSGFESRVKRETLNSKLETAVSENLFDSLLCAPGNHGAHAAGRAGFVQARFEELVDLRILVLVLDPRLPGPRSPISDLVQKTTAAPGFLRPIGQGPYPARAFKTNRERNFFVRVRQRALSC